MSIFPISIDYERSHGSYVFDKNTEKLFVDMHGHFSSLPLGYNHPVFKSHSFIGEITRVAQMKTSFCAYDCEEKQEFEKEFHDFAVPNGFDLVHYANTGALAVEAAVKTSWHHHNYNRKKVVCFGNSFHGVNSFGNFLSTSTRLNGVPKSDWVKNFDWNGPWQTYIEDHHHEIAAIIVEPIQCTFGDYYVPVETLKLIRDLCTQYGIVLIFDEVQTGLSTGRVWYFEYLNFEPDIIVFGKKFQVAGIIVRKGFDSIRDDIMRLSVTFDGDLCDMVRCKHIMREIQQGNLIENSQVQFLRLIWDVDYKIRNLKIKGCLAAFDFDTREERDDFYNSAFENGILLNSTGEKSIRMRPSLCITFDEMTRVIKSLNSVLHE